MINTPQYYKDMSKSVLQTGIAVANSMVGSSLILFPIIFLQYGVIESVCFVVMHNGIQILMALIMTLTCVLFVAPLQQNETDVSESVKRILGNKAFYAYTLICSFTVYLVSTVFFLLATGLTYDVLQIFIPDFPLEQKYFQIIVLAVFWPVCLLPNLKMVLKLAPIAMGALILSLGILMGSMPLNISNIDANYFKVKQFSVNNLLTIASICGFSFISHPSISPIMKENKDPSTNGKAVLIGYSITLIIYLCVGVVGSLAIYEIHTTKPAVYVMDYFQGRFQAYMIGILNVLYLYLIIPIFPYVARSQIMLLLSEKLRARKRIWLQVSGIYSVLWIGLMLMLILTHISPNAIISFIGAVMCYTLCYVLPFLMLYKLRRVNSHLDHSLLIPQGESQIIISQNTTPPTPSIGKYKIVIYTIILIYGAILMFGELYQLFSQL